MSRENASPDFNDFTRWIASQFGSKASTSPATLSLKSPEAPAPVTHSATSNEVSTGQDAYLASPKSDCYDRLLAAAYVARNEVLRAAETARSPAAAVYTGLRHFEVLELLAAADKSELSRPPELVTARGFRVTLAYDEGAGPDASSICVLVRCPPELITTIQGDTAYLWNGTERFELGQYDSEGKAIGTLPAGIEISLSDLGSGKVQLEEPPPATDG
jgi:hypothetical protein